MTNVLGRYIAILLIQTILMTILNLEDGNQEIVEKLSAGLRVYIGSNLWHGEIVIGLTVRKLHMHMYCTRRKVMPWVHTNLAHVNS